MARLRGALYGGPGIVSGFDSQALQRVSVPYVSLAHPEGRAPFFHPRWKPRESEAEPLEEFAPGYLACAGHSTFADAALTYTYLQHAKAGALVTLMLLDSHVPVIDRRSLESEWIVWSLLKQGNVPTILNPEMNAVGVDNRGNLFFAGPSPKNLAAGGYQWFVFSELTADVAPGDTITLYAGGDYLFLGEREAEEADATIWTPPTRQWDQKVEAELEVAYAKNEAPVAPGEPLREFIDEWSQFRESGLLLLDGLFAQNAKGPVAYYAYGAVWYQGSVTQLALEDPGEEDAFRLTVKGEGPIPLEVLPGPLDLLVMGDWTGSATPDGGAWDNLLDASVGGNHMVIDHLPPGPAVGVTHNGVGTGAGYAGVLRVTGVDVPAVVVGATLVGSEFVDDETLGRGGGALAQPGKRLTVHISGPGWSADAGHLEDGEDVSGVLVPLYDYFNWPSGLPLVSAPWAPTVAAEVRRVWRELAKSKRMPMPALAEVRVVLQVTAHTNCRWRVYGDAGEDAYAAGYVLRGGGGILTGEIWVGGVRVREGALECSAVEAASGVEFVVREDLRDGLAEAGNEKYAEWRNPLGEENVVIGATAGSLFNTLAFDWHATVNLYQPPPDEEYPGGPDGMTGLVASHAISLTYVKHGVTESKEAEEIREREERERREREQVELEEKRAEERAREKEEFERLEKQREEERERREERETKGEPESEEERLRREQREREERKIREERELREELEAEERGDGGGGEGSRGTMAVGEGVTSGTVRRNRDPR